MDKFAKALVPAVGTVLVVVTHGLITGEFDKAELDIAVTGLIASAVAYVVQPGSLVAPVRFPALQNREWLLRAYVERGLTTTQIGEQLGCTAAAVSAALKRHGIPARPRNAPLGLGYRRKMRVKRAVRTQKAIDRQRELRHAVALGPRARAVAEAHRKGDAQALRQALVELAACAEGWASLIPVGREVSENEKSNGARRREMVAA
jgi:predicted transcriptional regulator